ncbi:MAG: PEP-utilizing enzyme [Candidatus Woesearchaeota archaeon]
MKENPFGDREYEIVVNHRSDLLTQDLILRGIYKFSNFKQFGLSFDFPYVIYDNRTGDVHWSKKQVKEIRSTLLSIEQYEKLINDLEENKHNFQEYLKSFKEKLSLARNNHSIIKEFFEKTILATSAVSQHLLEFALAEEFENQGIPISGLKSAKTDSIKASEELKEIAEEFSAEVQKIKEKDKQHLSPKLTLKLNEYCNKYGYLGMKYFLGKPWNMWGVYQMLKNIDLTKKEDTLPTNIDYFDSPYLKFAEDLLRLRTEKFEMTSYACSLFRKMVVEYFSDIINYDNLLFLRVDEVIEVLSGKFISQDILSDRENFVLKIEDDGVKLITGLEKVIDEKLDLQEVKGIVACSGKIIGKVKIIFDSRDCHKVERGDVLIATMSTPDFLPAMINAAAFVTDIGGMTSHAAIISREMQKPCVIATKIATKVFKDGDLIEVDANTGIVKKLK